MFMVPTIDEVDTNNKMNMHIWESKYNKYDRDKNSLKENKERYFNIFLTHHPKELEQKLQFISG